MYNHPMQNLTKKIPPQVPLSQKTTLPFIRLPIGLSISPQKFHQISTTMNMTMPNNHEQNIPVILPQLDDIQELETDKENWYDGQFDNAELLYNHNSTEESDRIMSTLLTSKKLKIKNTILTILHKESNTTFLDLIITAPIHNQNSNRDSKTIMYTYPHPLY